MPMPMARPSPMLRLRDMGTVKMKADATASSLYTLLPSLIQQRVPMIQSLRRTASTLARAPRHVRTPSDVSDASRTPPPSYRTSARTSMCEPDVEDPADFSPFLPSRPSSAGSMMPPLDEEPEEGLQWKYAKQGYCMLSLATQQAHQHAGNLEFSRKLYVDGLEYLLRGLPPDLTPEEETSLRAALPASLQAAPAVPPMAGNQLAICAAAAAPPDDATAGARPASEPSLLHRVVAGATLQVVLFVLFVLPYVQLLLQQAYQYDRKHKISDRLFAQSLVTADAVGKQTVLLANSICAMNDGKVGAAVKDMGVWWIQGVSGGVYEGLGEGLQVLGLKPATTTPDHAFDRPRVDD